MEAKVKQPRKEDPLGRLKAFGLEYPWQTYLFLPMGYEDFRSPVTNFSQHNLQDGEWALFSGKVKDYSTKIDKGAPRIQLFLVDSNGTSIGCTFFGDVKHTQKILRENGPNLLVYGQVSFFNGSLWVKSPDIVHSAWVGKVRPKYPGKTKVITPETSRTRVLACMRENHASIAVDWLSKTLKMSREEMLAFSKTRAPSMEVLIQKAHIPDRPEQGIRAQAGIERLAALGIVRKAEKIQFEAKRRPAFGALEDALKTVPFQLTEEQQESAHGIIETFEAGKSHAMLSGDVGTGKTVVYGAVIAAALAAGLFVVVLLPNQALCEQIFREITSYWPHFSSRMITGDAKDEGLQDIPLLIGTSALLFRDIGRRDLIVVDEQQKFARHQREQLMSDGSMLLESTATCVPRTQALMHFGCIDVFRLKHCHVKKEIKTRIWSENERKALFKEVNETLVRKKKILVVYPKREADDPNENPCGEPQLPLPSAEEAFAQWEGLFPGRVRLAHGGLDDEINLGAIKDLREGKADILISTSLVEVGITIPSLERVLVVHAERFGLSTLHQIRGRVARDGGIGYCDLFLPRRVKDESFARLNVLVRTSDGFEVSREDMSQRGFGDLSLESQKQTGADEAFLFGRSLSVGVLDQVISEIEHKH